MTDTNDYSHILIRDLRVDMLIGIHDHEKSRRQPVLVNVCAEIPFNPDWASDTYEQTLCYDAIIQMIRKTAGAGHINLVETLAETIAANILEDNRVSNVSVRVEKTGVYEDAAAVGVEIKRSRK